jgi:hypothetical protein
VNQADPEKIRLSVSRPGGIQRVGALDPMSYGLEDLSAGYYLR